jgi:hypothetical protein
MRAVLCSVLVACWHAPAPQVAQVAPPFGIALERSTCSNHALLVPVELDGVRGNFIVDTGAFVNIVYEPFAKRAKLTLEDSHDRVGGGMGVRVMRVAPKTFAIPGLEVAQPSFMMLPTTSPLARAGCDIAGVISPATLVTDETALVVDFGAARVGQVAIAKVGEHLSRVTGKQFLASTRANEYTPGIDVAFGALRQRMMIDTGACCTWVTTSSGVGKANRSRSREGGKIHRLLGTTTSRVVRTGLVFGDVPRTLDVRLLAPDEGDAAGTGAIGADALTGCVVAISPSEIRGVCR